MNQLTMTLEASTFKMHRHHRRHKPHTANIDGRPKPTTSKAKNTQTKLHLESYILNGRSFFATESVVSAAKPS